MALLVPPKKGEKEFDVQYTDEAQYGRIQFWDDRYAKEPEPFEWYYGYSQFKATIRDNIPLDWNIMIAGCGSSNMPEDMINDGYNNITLADISRVIISQLKIRYSDIPELKYFQGTLCDTNLPESSFDAIIDKALFDSLLCSSTGTTTVAQYVYEIDRLLKDTGVFLLISHGNPELMLPFLEQYDIDEPYFTPWYIEVQAIAKPPEFPEEELDPDDPDCLYFIYICSKSEDLVTKKKAREGKVKQKAQKKKKERAPNL